MHNKNNEIRLNKDAEFSNGNNLFLNNISSDLNMRDSSTVDSNNQRKHKTKNSIANIKVSELHARVLKKNEEGNFYSNINIASSFNYKSVTSFNMVLGKANLSITKLQNLTKKEAANQFGKLYNKEFKKLPEKDLIQYTFQDIHAEIRINKNMENAANSLGMRGSTLKNILSKICEEYKIKKKEFTFKFLKDLPPNEAANRFSFYDQEIRNLILLRPHATKRRQEKLDPMLSQLHDMIQEEDARGGKLEKIIVNKLHHASIISLRMCLSGIKTSVRELQTLSKKDASEQFKGFYEKKISELPKRDFQQCTIRDIHKAILTTSCREEAGNYLGVRYQTCQHNLQKISQKHRVDLTYDLLQKKNEKEASDIFGGLYGEKISELLKKNIPLSNAHNPHEAIQNNLEINYIESTNSEPKNFLNQTLSSLHKIILNASNYDDIYQKINIPLNAFDDYLRVMGITYLILKNLSATQVSQWFGMEYEVPFNELLQKRKKTIATMDDLSYQNKRQKTDCHSSPNSQSFYSVLSEEKKLRTSQTASSTTTTSLAKQLNISNSPIFSPIQQSITNSENNKNFNGASKRLT